MLDSSIHSHLTLLYFTTLPPWNGNSTTLACHLLTSHPQKTNTSSTGAL